MSEDTEVIEPVANDHLILIEGKATAGKSASLRNIRDQPDWLYMCTEAGKKLPFRNRFMNGGFNVTDPIQVFEGFDAVLNGDLPNAKGLIVDSITFLMDQYESQYVLGSSNTMAAWGQYNQFFKTLMQTKVAKVSVPVIFTGHCLDVFNEIAGTIETAIPVKGALKNQGVEAYFSCVVFAERMPLKVLESYKNSMLNITDEDKELGFKYVFQTRHTKETVGKRIRSPMGMWTRDETFIDNDCQILLDHVKKYYE